MSRGVQTFLFWNNFSGPKKDRNFVDGCLDEKEVSVGVDAMLRVQVVPRAEGKV